MCQSGRMSTLGKRVMVKAIREFESLHLRHFQGLSDPSKTSFFTFISFLGTFWEQNNWEQLGTTKINLR
jgi:hypothetical protein